MTKNKAQALSPFLHLVERLASTARATDRRVFALSSYHRPRKNPIREVVITTAAFLLRR